MLSRLPWFLKSGIIDPGEAPKSGLRSPEPGDRQGKTAAIPQGYELVRELPGVTCCGRTVSGSLSGRTARMQREQRDFALSYASSA